MNVNEIARDRVRILLGMARVIVNSEPVLSKRYVELARRVAMRHRIKLGNKLFCKKCGAVFVLGDTLAVRISGKTRVFACLGCGAARKVSAGRSGFE